MRKRVKKGRREEKEHTHRMRMKLVESHVYLHTQGTGRDAMGTNGLTPKTHKRMILKEKERVSELLAK